jgi:hypothetical protein
MEPVLVDQGLNLGQFGDLVDQGTGVITDQGVAAAAAIPGPTLGDRAHFLGRDQAPQSPAMSRLPTPFATGGPGGRFAFQPDGIGGRRLGRIGGIELQPRLQIADALLQFGDPPRVRIQDSQEGNLGFRRDSAPERFRDGRLRNHAEGITRLLYKRFDP